MESPYQTPSADLTESAPIEGYGSLEKGIAGDYEFSIGATISEAWAKTKGSKGTLNLAFFLALLITMVLSIMFELLNMALGFTAEAIGTDVGLFIGLSIVQQVVLTAVTIPLFTGLFILGLRRSVDKPITAGSIFNHFDKTLPLLLTTLLMYVMLMIGFVLLILPGIYLSVAYYFALPLVIDKGLGPWQALEASRKAITKRWFAVFGLFLLLGILVLISTIPLGIGLIWTAPLAVIALGIAYRNMFGCETSTAA